MKMCPVGTVPAFVKAVVFSIMKFFVPFERRIEAVELLRSMHGRLEIIPECKGFWIEQRESPCSHILYAEQWQSEEAIYEHIRSALYRRVLAVIELSRQAPEINLYFISQIKGMELIQELRGAAAPSAN